ncbi:hypothetical protein EVAR_13394_1 [Eumeta japonica]|uniref:Nucleic-acid-binding protein from transposon X-element n=1 Tax=Eumeta variegata TaxID=151549 RepID=A0A4C1TSA4_EUMVA|nr:hypothetical protein EVAR_13394_1 [Eumeta japonica]
MQVDININREPAKALRVLFVRGMSSDSWSDDSNDQNDSDEEIHLSTKRKFRQPRLFATYGLGFICLLGKKGIDLGLSSTLSATPGAMPAKAPPTTSSWCTVGKILYQDAPVTQKVKTSKAAKSLQPTKTVNSKATTAATIAIDEAEITETPIPKKPQQLPPLFIHVKGRWSKIRKQCESKSIVILNAHNIIRGLKIHPAAVPDFQILSAFLVTLKFAYHTYSLKEEREFRVVLRGVPKELPIEEVKDLLTEVFPVQSVHWITNGAREPLELVLVASNTTAVADAIKCSILNIKVPCRAERPRAISANISFSKMTAGLRKNPSKNVSNGASIEDIKVLLSVVTSIDIGELALLAKKFKATANPMEKIVL